ncbi:hypothetical protein Goshw_003679, partial [Gossypium schwendimanii]|nr:hypothetical protein [Gossypium schwendimanii]
TVQVVIQQCLHRYLHQPASILWGLGLSFHWTPHFAVLQRDVLGNATTSSSPSHVAAVEESFADLSIDEEEEALLMMGSGDPWLMVGKDPMVVPLVTVDFWVLVYDLPHGFMSEMVAMFRQSERLCNLVFGYERMQGRRGWLKGWLAPIISMCGRQDLLKEVSFSLSTGHAQSARRLPWKPYTGMSENGYDHGFILCFVAFKFEVAWLLEPSCEDEVQRFGYGVMGFVSLDLHNGMDPTEEVLSYLVDVMLVLNLAYDKEELYWEQLARMN